MITKDDFYFCYSNKLSKFLEERGIRYLFLAKEYKTSAPFSIYHRTQELSNALTEYKQIN